MLSTYHPVTVFIFCRFNKRYRAFYSSGMHYVKPCGCNRIRRLAKGAEAVRFGLTAALPVIVVFTIVNPLVNHKGSTIFLYKIQCDNIRGRALRFVFRHYVCGRNVLVCKL